MSTGRRRPRAGLGTWFVRRSPDDTAGVLSPAATAAVVLALVLVVSLSIRSVADATGGGPETATAQGPRRPLPSAPVTLAFGGDVHFERWLAAAVRDDPTGALATLTPLLGDADLAVVNLETAVTDRGTPAAKEHTFRAPADGLTALASAGVDVVSIANNHGMDYGPEGLIDTLRTARHAGLTVVGGGRDDVEAYRPHIAEIHGRRVAIVAATQVLDSSTVATWTARADQPGLASAKPDEDGLARLLAAVHQAARDADTVAVMLHWGREKDECPLPAQTELAAQLRAAGADIIVGGHAHRLAGGGRLGDAVVHYGLGNLVFYARQGPATASGVLAVTIAPDGDTTVVWRPAVLRDGVAAPVGDDDHDAAVAGWEHLRACTDLTAEPAAAPAPRS